MVLELQAHHPSYDERSPDWELIADVCAGQRVIKAKGATYLPPTSGMRVANYGTPGTLGQAAYDAYRVRAVFHGFAQQAIAGLVGVVHRKPPVVKVPLPLERMVASMTLAGESLEILWQRITEAQLGPGHGGLLVDVPDGVSVADSIPYVAMYGAASILNWNENEHRNGRGALSLVVLDESAPEQQPDLSWAQVTQIRVLALGASAAALVVGTDGDVTEDVGTAYQTATARQGVGDDGKQLTLDSLRTPSIGSLTLDRIPFVFFNTNDVTATPGTPPLLGLADLDIAVYRGEADYRQSLFMQSQDTLCRIGADMDINGNRPEVATGAGAVIDLPMGGDARFIGVSSAGMSEQRQALENDKAQASAHIVQLLDTGGGKSAESGEALRVRVSARTATLATMQLVAAAALRDCLVFAGRWLGLSDAALAEIEVVPNLDFADDATDPLTVSMLMDAKVKGAPLSMQSIHRYLRLHEFTELEYEAETEQIAAEVTDQGGSGGTDVEIDPAAVGGRRIGAVA